MYEYLAPFGEFRTPFWLSRPNSEHHDSVESAREALRKAGRGKVVKVTKVPSLRKRLRLIEAEIERLKLELILDDVYSGEPT